MEIILILVFIAVVVVGFVIYKKIMTRGKKCPFCGEKYDSSCIQDAAVASKSYGGNSNFTNPTHTDYTDVKVVMLCKKCKKKHTQTITIRSKNSERNLDSHVRNYFDK